MIWIVLTIVYVLIGFILAIVWDYLDWADIHEELMVLAFMMTWPLIVAMVIICGVFKILGYITTKLGVGAVHLLKRWVEK